MQHDSTRSLIELVIVGVVSGAGGALLTTLLRVSHEREERMRERMIVAAHDLAAGVTQAVIPLRVFFTADRTNPDEAHAAEEAIKEVRRLTDEAVARLPLVELLFGQGSAAAQAGVNMIDELSGALQEAEKTGPNLQEVQIYSHQAAERFGEFIGAVHGRITRSRWRLRR